MAIGPFRFEVSCLGLHKKHNATSEVVVFFMAGSANSVSAVPWKTGTSSHKP